MTHKWHRLHAFIEIYAVFILFINYSEENATDLYDKHFQLYTLLSDVWFLQIQLSEVYKGR